MTWTEPLFTDGQGVQDNLLAIRRIPRKTSIEERVRVQNLGLDLVALSQGIPFYLAGGELLRSKSFDRDSYNSGDWFNQLDYTYSKNNWGIGLPPKDKNEAKWKRHQLNKIRIHHCKSDSEGHRIPTIELCMDTDRDCPNHCSCPDRHISPQAID